MSEIKVLIVDDSHTSRQMVVQALEPGFRVLEAGDGREGLKIIEQTPDLAAVLLDVNMPGMDGIEMLTRVKAGGQHAHLPVVMLTAEIERAVLDRAKVAGALGCIIKPAQPELLLKTVQKMIRRGAAGARAQA